MTEIRKILTRIDNVWESSNYIEVEVAPFKYDGKKINRLKVEKGNKSEWDLVKKRLGQPTFHGWAEINLGVNGKLERDGDSLKIKDGTAKKWEPENFVFKFRPISKSTSADWTNGGKQVFKIKIEETKLSEDFDLAPMIEEIRMDCIKNEKYQNHFLYKGQKVEYQLNFDRFINNFLRTGNFNVRGDRINPAVLDVSGYWGKLNIEKIENGNTIKNETEEEKVRRLYEAAIAAYENRENDLKGAAEALEKLISTITKGTEEEQMVWERNYGIIPEGAEHSVDSMKKKIEELQRQKGSSTTNFDAHEEKKIRSKIRQTIQNASSKGKFGENLEEIKELIAALKNIKDSNGDKGWEVSEYNSQSGDAALKELEDRKKYLENKNNNGNKNKEPGAENIPGNNTSSQGQKGSEEIEAKQDNAKKDAESSAKLSNVLQGLSNDKTEEEKEKDLKEIENLKNQGGAYEQQKGEVAEKKNELAKSDPVKYGKMIAKVIQQKMDEFKVEITKLGNELQEKFTKLQNGEFTSDDEVRAVEEEVSEKVSEEVANVEVNDLLTQANKLIKDSVKSLQSQLTKIKKDLYSLKSSTNPYQQKAYQTKKDKVEQALKDLEKLSQNTTQPTGVSPWKIIVPVSLVLVIAIVAAIVIRRKKRSTPK